MLSQHESVQRMRLGGAGRPDESPEDDPEVEAAVEQVLHLREVAVSVFAVAEGVVRAGKGRLQIAQDGVHGQERWVLDAGRTAAGDVGLMKVARALHGLEATHPSKARVAGASSDLALKVSIDCFVQAHCDRQIHCGAPDSVVCTAAAQ